MTYPPARHVLSDMCAETRYFDGVGEMRAPVTEGVLDRSGATQLGVLAIMVDVTGAVVALPGVAPDWIATSNLSINLIEPLRGDGVLVRCSCVRKGSKSVVVECKAHSIDAENVAEKPSAVGLMLFSRIPGSASVANPTYSDSRAWAGLGAAQQADLGRLDERLGIGCSKTRSKLEVGEYVSNSFGTVNGGVQCALACAEAERVAGQGSLCTDLQLHFLSQVGDGPLVAKGEVLRTEGTNAVIDVRLSDASDDRLVAIATVHCSI
jgi:acyl-coenzyme A thioesterase PaaI-like protein